MHRSTGIMMILVGLFAFPAFGSEIEFIFYKAPTPLNWSSPGRLVKSTLRNMRDPREWQTLSAFDFSRQYSTAVWKWSFDLSRHDSPKRKCLLCLGFLGRGVALDSLLINVRGRFYTRDEILEWLGPLKRLGYVRTFKLILNDDQCNRAQRYLKTYEELRLNEIYGGLRSEPNLGEGAGCSAFAISFLEVLGFMSESMRAAWRRELLVPVELLRSRTRSAKIGVIGYLRGRDRPWASENEKHIRLEFWDPEKMFNWVGNVTSSLKDSQHMWAEKESGSRFPKLVWDVSSYPTAKNYF